MARVPAPAESRAALAALRARFSLAKAPTCTAQPPPARRPEGSGLACAVLIRPKPPLAGPEAGGTAAEAANGAGRAAGVAALAMTIGWARVAAGAGAAMAGRDAAPP